MYGHLGAVEYANAIRFLGRKKKYCGSVNAHSKVQKNQLDSENLPLYRKLGSHNVLIVSDFRTKAEKWAFCTCAKISTPCLKNKQNYFCYNYAKLPPDVTIFGTKMAKSPTFYEVHSFSISHNSCPCTTLLNADVPNCYITLQL